MLSTIFLIRSFQAGFSSSLYAPILFPVIAAPPRTFHVPSTVTLVEKQQRLVDDLAIIDDPQERLAAVITRARKLPPLSPAERSDQNRVRGCVSEVYLLGAIDAHGRCHFRCDADSPLVRGLVALLCDFFTGATPAEILASDADPLAALGLVKNLSPTRQNGLGSARASIRAFAEKKLPANHTNPRE